MKEAKIGRDLLISLMKRSKENSKRLLDESKTLYEQKMYATSTFLSITALEELGKTYLCFTSEWGKEKVSEEDFKVFSKRFSDHEIKELNGLLGWYIQQYANRQQILPQNISKLWELIADGNLLRKRNACLYVDYNLEEKSALVPSENIKQEEAKYFLKTVQEVCDRVYVHFQ
jgi:AbiV family abortive infection protein